MVLNGGSSLLQNLCFGHPLSLHSIVVIVFIQGQQIRCIHGLAKAQMICFQVEIQVFVLNGTQMCQTRFSTQDVQRNTALKACCPSLYLFMS